MAGRKRILTEEQEHEVQYSYWHDKISQRELARIYEVGQDTVKRITQRGKPEHYHRRDQHFAR